MEKVQLIFKSEPAGEYTLGQIDKDSLMEKGFVDANNFLKPGKDFDEDVEDELLMMAYEYNDVVAAYGISTQVSYNFKTKKYECSVENLEVIFRDHPELHNNLDKINIVVEEDVNFYNIDADSYYLQYSAPTKQWSSVELDVDVKDFDPSKLTIYFKMITLPFDDSYGDIDELPLICGIEYDGKNREEYDEEYLDNIDYVSGARSEVIIFHSGLDTEEQDFEICYKSSEEE